jgi:hypothetical protein
MVRLPLAEWLNGWMMWHEREEGLNEQFVSFIKCNGAPDDDAAAIFDLCLTVQSGVSPSVRD